MTSIDRIAIKRKTGAERFLIGGTESEHELLGFWRWSASGLASNATRGVLAEYIVACALGADTSGVRDEWAAFDLLTPDGVKVEVKSAAFLQSWAQPDFSRISYRAPKTRALDSATNSYADNPQRQADVYVFCLLIHKDKETLNPMDLEQWRFFVLPRATLDDRTRSQHSITLPSL